jgi:hypothetical protein
MGFTQHDAFYLQNAVPYEEGLEDGTYVWLQGPALVEDAPLCPGSETEYCLKSYLRVEEYLAENQIVCGDLSDNVTVITQVEDRCDTEGNCESCYNADVYSWEVSQDLADYAELRVNGVYVEIEGAVFLDELGVQSESETRIETSSSFPIYDELLVAGPVKDNAIMSRPENQFIVVSTHDFEESFDELVLRDKSIKQGFNMGALFLWVIGLVVLASQFIKPLTGVLRVVPILGAWADDTIRTLTYVIVALLGAVLWCLTTFIADFFILF